MYNNANGVYNIQRNMQPFKQADQRHHLNNKFVFTT